MIKFISWGLALCAISGFTAETNTTEIAKTAVAETVTETATEVVGDKMTFDYDDNFVIFEGNVKVTDPQMVLTCNKLLIRFETKKEKEGEPTKKSASSLDGSGAVSWIEATGSVVIEQEDKKAIAEKITHDVKTGEFVLTGDPHVIQGTDMLSGDVIRYWRGETRMVCEPRAKLTIYVEKSKSSEGGMFATPKKK